MKKFYIPVSKIEDLSKKIKRIQNKGADIIFEIGKEVVFSSKFSNNVVANVRCYEVEVEGKYQVNDWKFVAVIEHGGVGNIIRLFDFSFENKIPDKYKTAGRECEHCHRIRDRKDTYLIYNEKTKEFKQVGRTCLQEYTDGLDAERCAMFSDVLSYIAELENKERDYSVGSFSSGESTLLTDSIKKIIYAYVKRNGYVPKSTAQELGQIIFGAEQNSLADASDDEIKKMDEWVTEISKSSSKDYIWNAQIAWNKKYSEFRDIALLASFVNTYLKSMTKRDSKDSSANVYVGSVGDKITVENIKSVRVLYTKSGGVFGYNVPDTNVYEIIDDKGHTYIWSTSNLLDAKEIEKIDATVKEHKEYKGTKQTIITRGKVTNVERDIEKAKEQNKKTMKELDDTLSNMFEVLNNIDD